MSNPPQARCVKCGELYPVCPLCDAALPWGPGKTTACVCGWNGR